MAKIPSIRIYQRGGTYWLDFRLSGQRYRWPGGSSETEAEIQKSKVVQAIGSDTFTGKREAVFTPTTMVVAVPTFNEVADLFLARHAAQKKSAKFYQTTVETVRRGLGDKADLPVDKLTTADLEDYMADRREDVETATANRSLRVLKMVLDRAVRWGHIDRSPASYLKMEKEENGREFFATREQFKALLAACPAWLQPIVLCAAYTGGRRAEVLGLTWADVDFRKNRIRHTKSKKNRTVPMSSRLRAVLAPMAPDVGNGFVFTQKRNPGKATDVWTVRDAFNAAVREADLRAQTTDSDGEMVWHWFRFHDLRHTYASWQVQKGTNLNTVRALLGHADFKLTLRYAHLAPEHLDVAAEVLDGLDAAEEPERFGHKIGHSPSQGLAASIR